METQLVTSLGVEIGGRTVPQQPMQQTRMGLESPLEDAFEAPTTPPVADGPVTWSQGRGQDPGGLFDRHARGIA